MLIQILTVKSYEPDTDFMYVCTVTLTWRYDLGSRSWHILESWTTTVWNIIQIQYGSEELWPGHGFWVCAYCDLDIGGMTLGQGHDTPWGHGQQLCEILSRSNMAVRSYGLDTDMGLCALWPWPCRYDLGSRSWHTFGTWTTIVWNIIHIQQGDYYIPPKLCLRGGWGGGLW